MWGRVGREWGGGVRVFGSIKIKKAVIDFEALCRLRETQNRADCGESLWLRPERKCSVTLTGWRRKCWWTELNKGGKGLRGWWVGFFCGGMTLMFSIDKTEKPRCYATHTHTQSHKFMHLFTGNAHSEPAAGALSHAYFKENIHKHLV